MIGFDKSVMQDLSCVKIANKILPLSIEQTGIISTIPDVKALLPVTVLKPGLEK